MAGGGPGASGKNLLIRPGHHAVSVPGKMSLPVGKGTRFRIESPGGGGWGAAEES